MDPYEDIDLKNDLVLVFEKTDRYKELMFVKSENEWAVVWKAVECIWEGKPDHRKAYADLFKFPDDTVLKFLSLTEETYLFLTILKTAII